MIGIIAIVVCCIISALYIECVKYKEGRTVLAFKKWDLLTCTASDYSVRLNLSEEWYEAFKQFKEE